MYKQKLMAFIKAHLPPIIKHFLKSTIYRYTISPGKILNKYYCQIYPELLLEPPQRISHQKSLCKFSIIMPVYNPQPEELILAVKSVIDQTDKNWELLIVDDASTTEYFEQLQPLIAEQSNIRLIKRDKNGHIVRATNDGIRQASGDYIAFIDQDDYLWPNALNEIRYYLKQHPQSLFIYTDEDKLSADGAFHFDPFYKPDFSPIFLESVNYLNHFTVIKRSLLNSIGNLRQGTEGAQDWDLALRIVRYLKRQYGRNYQRHIGHIRKILYSWRAGKTSAANSVANYQHKRYAYSSQHKVLANYLNNHQCPSIPQTTSWQGIWKQVPNFKLQALPLVSIIIPTKDNVKYLRPCLQSIFKKTTYHNFEVILIDNGSELPKTLTYFQQLANNQRHVKVIRDQQEFNFSRLCNRGAKSAKGQYLLFLNDDTEVRTENWLEQLVQYAIRDEVGAVGARLLFKNNQIQHNGITCIYPQVEDTIPINLFQYYSANQDQSPILNTYIQSTRETQALSGACLLIRKKLFTNIGGFDERYRIAFNDVELCLRLRRLGYSLILNPNVHITHYQSISVGNIGKNRSQGEFLAELHQLRKNYASEMVFDPFFNSNLLTFGNLFFFQKKVASRFQVRPPLILPLSRKDVESFTISQISPLIFPKFSKPSVSIIIVNWNKWQYTYNCLKSISENIYDTAYEIILIDNHSSDESQQLYQQLSNIKIVINEENKHYLTACNQGAALARGQYLYLLNNDTAIVSNTISALLSVFKTHPKTGAVGSKLVYPNGVLQEAGSILFSEGSGLGYGRNDYPQADEYCFLRDTDYCSAASLLIPRKLYSQLGGMKNKYAPAYYEDTDLCLEVWKQGWNVYYQPNSIVYHFEYTSSKPETAVALMQRNRKIFLKSWQKELREHSLPSLDNLRQNRYHYRFLPKQLLVLPSPMSLQYGANKLIKSNKINSLTHDTIAFDSLHGPWPTSTISQLEQAGCEIITTMTATAHLQQHRDCYQTIRQLSRNQVSLLKD